MVRRLFDAAPARDDSVRDESVVPTVTTRHRDTRSKEQFHAMADPGCGRLPLRFRNHHVRRRSLSD
jgi:hypothetical protein